MKNKVFLAMILLNLSVVYAEDKRIDQPEGAIKNQIMCEVRDDIFADIPDNEASIQGKKRFSIVDSDKKIVETDLLFVKDKGAICSNLNVGKNVLVGNQVVFNTRKGCNKLLAKGAIEKNLLNLRSTFCFVCDPGLTCTLDNDCGLNSVPAVGCLDTQLNVSSCQTLIERCSGAGITADKAEICVSGAACDRQSSLPFQEDVFETIEVTTNIQIEVCIPLAFCSSFCDRPTTQATYEDNSSGFNNTFCVQDKPITGTGRINPDECIFSGRSVTILVCNNINLQKVSRATAFLKFKLTYQNCIGIRTAEPLTDYCILELRQKACEEQKDAIQAICKNANKILRDACFDVSVEGRIQ